MHKADTLLECLGGQRLSTTELKKIAADEHGISRSRFFSLLKELVEGQKVSKSPIDGKWEQIRPKSQNRYEEKDQ